MGSDQLIDKNLKERNNKRLSSFNTESDPVLLYYIFRKNLFLFIGIITICLISVYVYLRYTVPIYESALTFQIGTLNTANQVLDVNNFYESDDDIAIDVEILKSKLLFKRALSKLPLDISYYNKGKILTNELYKSSPIRVDYTILDSALFRIPFHVKLIDRTSFEVFQGEKSLGKFKSGDLVRHPKLEFKIRLYGDRLSDADLELFRTTGLYFKINDINRVTSGYISRLSVVPMNASAKTISISFKDNNALKTSDIVTAVANEYIEYDIEQRSRSSKKVLEFVDNQLDKHYNRLKVSEGNIENFQKNSNFKDLELSSIYFDRTNKLQDDLIDIDLKSKVLIEIKKSISRELKNSEVYDLLPILSGTEYEGDISTMIKELKESLVKKENMRYEVTSDSEVLKSLDHKIEIQKKILFESISSLIDNFKIQKKEILGKIEAIEKKFLDAPAQQIEYARLQRVLSIDEKFFTLLMDKKTEYSISEAGFVTQHKILHEASLPTSPVYPKKNVFYIGGIVVGLVISIVLLLTIYVLKNTISSIDEITMLSYAPIGVLGIIPKYKRDIPISQLVVDKNPKSVIAESFRVIRSNLQFISPGEEKKLIAITSTVSGEGKTFCAINIGGIIAYSGKKVIILDLDMRKPKIHMGFGVDNNIGMSTLLIGKADFSECIQHSNFKNLDFITSGPIPPNPSELIISGRLDDIVEGLKEIYDYVIIDNPPIGLVSDAMEMLKKADYPIYVFKNDYSKKSFISNLDRLVLDNGIKRLAVVLNSVDMRKVAYGGGYGYGYGYGGGYGYGYGYGNGYGEDYYDTKGVMPEKEGILSRIFSRKKDGNK